MSLSHLWRRLWRYKRAPAGVEARGPAQRDIDVRIPAGLFERVRAHVEDFSRGEEAGFLLCGLSRLDDRDVLLARKWLPVPEEAIARGEHGSVLSWSADFNSRALAHAVELNCAPVLIHSHGTPSPRFSPDDMRKERPLFGAFSRIVAPLPTGTLLLGCDDAAGSFWLDGRNDLHFRRLVIIGDTIETWHTSTESPAHRPRRARLDRQSLAIGPKSDAKLADAKVAIIGVSGGGSHVVQQLAHQGVGTLIPVDDQTVDESNLGRLVGAVHTDIDTTLKVEVAHRVATGIDPSIQVMRVPKRFPSKQAIKALKEADIVVACLDRFDAREAVNAFCRRYLIPLVDVGIEMRSAGERLVIADGQVIVSRPGQPCLRCWFITDPVLEREQRERPTGYDRSPDTPGDPQVVSMNGVLASEACNCVLDLITGYSGGRRGSRAFWQYEGRTGQLEQCKMPSHRPLCPACAEEAYGDPAATQTQPTTEV
jgi:molybdopterin/thiamine biosynthesis adenylyltransferase